MEKAKISAFQLFVMIALFEFGSAILIPLAIGAKQDAWLSIVMGMVGGFLLFFIYYRLYLYYPDMLPTGYVQKIIGRIPGKMLAFLYMIYFIYLASRDLRDFGAMLVTSTYPDSPLFVVNALLMLLVIYTLRFGIEVLARTGELLFFLFLLITVSALVLISSSGLIDFRQLQPVLENGFYAVFKTVYMETLYVPFGEAIVFTMIFPYLNERKKLKRVYISAMTLSGLSLAFAMIINVSVLGVDLTSRSQFPILSTIQMIELAEFLERLDVYFLLVLIIGIFFKLSLYFYVAASGIADLFQVKEPSQLIYPMGIIILLSSISIAGSYAEHIEEGLKLATIYVQLPVQVVIPAVLLIIAFFKNKKTKALPA
ncbi:GerAB/ArcD/ProY family transporter [Domibacillus enclensis]|uniref:Spore germination protein KB n=1 Tax=Domibacillus enclensis TaxID=1017273 RepID=A0A1N6YBF7_9BACI|nr:GerAB/ArcD/ProY family transporter [Domibacillus enclensis]OXS77579.1 spore gernimation protein KB [Domibacillus enclensis]SIR11809.1 spore germination protein KB [Domibacillus enclensis]